MAHCEIKMIMLDDKRIKYLSFKIVVNLYLYRWKVKIGWLVHMFQILISGFELRSHSNPVLNIFGKEYNLTKICLPLSAAK